jgi:hypothetical protein
MTAVALSNEFDLLWDNIQSGSAPGVDDYEKSLFFTIAQEELIKMHSMAYDKSEISRRILHSLVKAYEVSTASIDVSVTLLDSSLSKLFLIPSDTWLILQENIIINSKIIDVEPVKLDQVNRLRKNPFRKPSSKKCWRTEISSTANVKYIELLVPGTISKYQMRYVTKPTPIVTKAMTLRGTVYSATVNPVINSIADNDLVDMAVKLAYKAFMDGQLHSQN